MTDFGEKTISNDVQVIRQIKFAIIFESNKLCEII